MKSPVFRSFRRRLLTGFLLIGMVPLILQTILSLSVFMTALNRNAQASADNRLSGLRWELERLLDVCEETAGALSLNERMRTALDGMGPVSATEIYSILYESAASILYGADISVYGGDGKRLFSTSGSPGLETLPLNWGLLRAAAASRGETALRNAGESQEDQGGDAVCLEIARALPGDGSGFVVIRISQRVFSRLLAEKYDGADDAVYVMDAYWRPVYSSNPARDRDEAGRLRAQYLAGQRLTGAEGDAAYYAAGIGDSGLVILLRQPAPLANWALMLLYWVTGVIILICLAVCLITAMNISSQLYKPVKRLNMAMTELENGNLDVRINSGRTDEMGQLSGRFDRMAGQLQINIKQSLERQKELDNTRLRMLQAQLNPHFLYNTLDAMKWICISNNVPEAAVVSSSLAEILRAGIAGHEFVPLNEELKLLERYVGIQQIRFPDKFSFKAEPDADTLDASVPALMLQPLVENAILHGFEQIDGGRVSVKSFIQDGVLYIDVLDDGEGIPPELVERLEDVEYRDEGHLGIHNVASILRMFYGEPYGLRVMPAEKGAWIRLSMPFILNGQEGTP